MESRMFDLPLPLRPVIELKESSLERRSQRIVLDDATNGTCMVDHGVDQTLGRAKHDNVPSCDHRTRGVRLEALSVQCQLP